MMKKGKVFSSGIWGLPERHPVLSDGSQVHSAEVAVQAVEYWYETLRDLLGAVKKVLIELNTESANLFLFADHPGMIVFSNSNQHIVYQQNADGVYLSVTALGLPGRCGMELPCNSVGIITPDSICMERLHYRFETCYEQPESMVEVSLEFIRNNPGCSLAHVADKVLKPLFPENTLNYRVGFAHRVLEQLVQERKIEIIPTSCTGGMGTPGTVFKLFGSSTVCDKSL